jgi:C-terminal topoisomerase domain
VSIVNLYVLAKYRIEKKLTQIDAKIEKMELDKKVKEDLKTVALGTSKINYLDPRITVAWCKRHEVPIEKVIFAYGFVDASVVDIPLCLFIKGVFGW